MKSFFPKLCFLLLVSFNTSSQTAGDYRSFGTGDWSIAANWERFNGTVWVNPAPAAPSSSDNAINILSTHVITISTTITADQLTINAGGTLTISSTGSLTIVDGAGNDLAATNNTSILNVSGNIRLEQNATITSTTATNAHFLSGGRFQLNYATTSGSIPIASWHANSTCEIRGYTTVSLAGPANLNQSFGHFTYSCASQANGVVVNFNGQLTSVAGNLTFDRTGSNINSNSGYVILAYSTPCTLNVVGNLTIQNNSRVFFSATSVPILVNVTGNFNFNSQSGNGSVTNYNSNSVFNIDGNFNMTAGAAGFINMARSALLGSTVFNLKGDMNFTSGKIIESNNSTGVCTINFIGTNQTYTGAGTFQNNVNFFVGNGSSATSLTINSSITGSDGNFAVNNLSSMNIAANAFISGTGLFTVGSGATLRLASIHASGALQTGTTAGNVRTSGTRTYNANSTIEYNGASLQYTGDGLITTGDVVFNTIGGTGLSTSLTTPRNVTIQTILSLNSPISYPLALRGNWVNNGIFFAFTGGVFFQGSTPQTISGNNSSFYDLNITNGTSTVTILSAQDLTNTLTLGNNAKFITTGQTFTLLSTATSTARIAQVPSTATFTGNITMNRLAPAGYTGWAFFGSPVLGRTLADWDDNIYTSGFTGADGSASGFVSILSYDESVAGIFDNGYVNATNETNSIGVGQGFWVYLGNAGTTSTDIIFDVTGSPIIGDTNLPVTYHSTSGGATEDGWNLVANPYPSEIDWNAAGWGKTNIDNSVYVYNADLNGGAGDYATYIGGVSSPAVGSGGINNLIPSSQGFYIHANATSPVLRARESIKTTGNPIFRSEEEAGEVFRMQLFEANIKVDETAFRMDANGTVEHNKGMDAYKMFGGKPFASRTSLYSRFKDEAYVIKSIPLDFASTIPLHIRTNNVGIYTIKAIDIKALSTSKHLFLEDKLDGKFTDLEKNDSYTFNIDGNWPEETPRFIIHFREREEKPSVDIVKEPIFISNTNGIDVIFNYDEYSDVEVTVHNILGQKITSDKKIRVRSEKISVNIADQVSGVYFITLKSEGKTVTKKFFK